MTRETRQCQKNIGDDAMPANCDVIVFFQFAAIQRPHSGCMVCKTYIFSNYDLLSYKTSSHATVSSKGTIFAKNCWVFAAKKLISAKLRGLSTKGTFSETAHVCVCVHTYQIQVSRIILTSFKTPCPG